MSPVFGHGQLRLYLLSILADGPRHGYDVIVALEDRFQGLYSPSAGTVYPRLAKLEEEGLVTRSEEGRKTVYALTPEGLAEVQSRRDDVVDLEAELDRSRRELADEMRQRVRASAKDLRAELKEAAAQARRTARTRGRADRSAGLSAGDGPGPRFAAGQLPGPSWATELLEVLDQVGHDANARVMPPLTEEQLREIRAIVGDAARRIREVVARELRR